MPSLSLTPITQNYPQILILIFIYVWLDLYCSTMEQELLLK